MISLIENWTDSRHVALVREEQMTLKSFEKTFIVLNPDAFHSLCFENDVTERKASRRQRQRKSNMSIALVEL